MCQNRHGKGLRNSTERSRHTPISLSYTQDAPLHFFIWQRPTDTTEQMGEVSEDGRDYGWKVRRGLRGERRKGNIEPYESSNFITADGLYEECKKLQQSVGI